MNYLEKNVLCANEAIQLQPVKSPALLILRWVWGVLGCWLLLIPTIKAISATIEYKTTEYLVTEKRIMEKYGWIATHTDELSLDKIENITVDYTFFGKILNYGTLRFQCATFNNITFANVKDAEALKKKINELL